MSAFEVSKKIHLDQEISKDELSDFLEKKLKNLVNVSEYSVEENSITVTGNVKGNMILFPYVRYTATISIKEKDGTYRVSVSGNSKPNKLFWITIIIGTILSAVILGLALLTVALIGYFVRKDVPRQAFESILNSADNEFG